MFHQPVFKKITLAGLNSLQQKRCSNSTRYFMILPPKNIFSKHQNKAEFKNKDNSEVPSSNFQTLEPLQPQRPQQPHFIKEFTGPDGWII